MGEQTDAFLEFDYDQLDQHDQKLQGEAVDVQFQNRFQLISFNFSLVGAKNASGGAAGKGGKANTAPSSGGSKPGTGGGSGDEEAFPPFNISMPTQVGSAWLMKLCTQFASGKPNEVEKLKIKTASVYIRRAGANYGYADKRTGQDWFLSYTMGGVTIASYATTNECVDTFALNYETMTVSYYRCHPKTGLVMTGPYVEEDPNHTGLTDNAPVWFQSRSWVVGGKTDADLPDEY